MDSIKVKIPRAFDLNGLPAKLMPVKDYIAWVLHKLRDGRPHRLMARHLDNLFPRDRCTWTIVKNWLITEGFLDRPLPYDKGSHPYGFRLARVHRPRKGLPHRGMKPHLITDISLIKKLRRRWTKQSADMYSQHASLFEVMRTKLGRLRIDGQGLDQYFYARRWGRIFTPLTSLSKVRRRSVTLNGQCLAQIDIKNCQPLLLVLIARIPQCQLPKAVAQLLRSREYIDLDLSLSGRGEGRRGHALVLDDPKIAEDVREALELCQSGTFYEALMAPGQDRDKLKVDFYRSILFGPGYPSPASRAFQARFPTLDVTVRRIKRGDHRRLARVLQKIESSLMIGQVATSLLEDHRGLWFATLHDALLVRPEDVEIASGAIIRAFATIGLRPSLDVRDFI